MASSLPIAVFNSGYKPIPGPSTIITGHKDPGALDDDAARVLDQSRRYIEDFGQAVARSSMPRELIEEMLALYPTHGNRYTLFAAASSQFPG